MNAPPPDAGPDMSIGAPMMFPPMVDDDDDDGRGTPPMAPSRARHTPAPGSIPARGGLPDTMMPAAFPPMGGDDDIGDIGDTYDASREISAKSLEFAMLGKLTGQEQAHSPVDAARYQITGEIFGDHQDKIDLAFADQVFGVLIRFGVLGDIHES